MTSPERDLKDIFRRLNLEERKKMLARVLNFSEFNEEDDLKAVILIDVHYEMLSHFVSKGFLWSEVASSFEIFEKLLNKAEGKSLLEAISLFKEEIVNNGQHLRDDSLKCVVDYIFLTFFQHFKLYQFMLTQERASHTTKLHSVVEPPLQASSMKEGQPKSVWDEQQRLKQIDEMECQRNQERASQFDEEMQHALHQLEEHLCEFESLPEQLTREQLVAIIGNVTANKVAVASASISQQIHQVHDALEFKCHRTNVGHEANKEDKKSAASSRRPNGLSAKK